MNIAKDTLPLSGEFDLHTPASDYAAASDLTQPRVARDVPRNGVETEPLAEATPRMIPELSREQLRLRNNLLLARERQGVRSLVVSGTGEGVGVTAVATTNCLI